MTMDNIEYTTSEEGMFLFSSVILSVKPKQLVFKNKKMWKTPETKFN